MSETATGESGHFPGAGVGVERRLDAIERKLDRLDEALRGTPGNGSKPSILIRLDRLEQDARRQSRLIWLIVGAGVTAAASGIAAWIAG